MSHHLELPCHFFQPADHNGVLTNFLDAHVINVRCPVCRVVELDTIGAGTEVKCHVVLLERVPVRCLHRNRSCFDAIQNDGKPTVFCRGATEVECVVAFLCHIDILPQERVAALSSKPADRLAAACRGVAFVDGRADGLIVVNLLIVVQEGCFGFIEVAFQPGLCLKLVDASAMSRHDCGQGSLHRAQVLVLEEVAHQDLSAEINFAEADAHLFFAVGRVVECHSASGAVKREDVFRQDVCLADVLHDMRLQPQRVLIQGDEFLVLQQGERSLLDGRHVTTDEQGRGHDAPHTEVRFVFLFRHRTAHLEHVHVVIAAVVAIGRKIEVLIEDAFHGFPAVVDVARSTPRGRYVVAPGARIRPSAKVVAYVLTRCDDGIVDGCVLLLLVQPCMVAATVVDLDEIKLQLVEVEVGIHLFIAVEAHVGVLRVAIADAAASAVACIAVDARLQSFGMDIVADDLQAIWEALRMDANLAVRRAAVLEAVVDVDVHVAHILQPL